MKQPCDEGMIQSTSLSGKLVLTRAQSAGTWVLVATILGSSMAFIDSTVVNVALPVLQTNLKATVADTQWVVEAYALFLAALILVGGSLGDHSGRRRMFATGIALFTLASLACGFAPNITFLIIARAAQGIGGALLVPGSLAIIGAFFDSEQRGRAIGTWSGFTAITSALGPVLGGWLVQYASWRWVFFINLPIAAIVLFILFAIPGIGGSYWTTFFPAVVVLGIGMAVAVAPLTTAVMGSVDPQRTGIASGINNAVARAAGLLAIATLGIVALASFSAGLDSNLNALALPSGVRTALVAQQNKLVGIDIPAGLSNATHAVALALVAWIIVAWHAQSCTVSLCHWQDAGMTCFNDAARPSRSVTSSR